MEEIIWAFERLLSGLVNSGLINAKNTSDQDSLDFPQTNVVSLLIRLSRNRKEVDIKFQ